MKRFFFFSMNQEEEAAGSDVWLFFCVFLRGLSLGGLICSAGWGAQRLWVGRYGESKKAWWQQAWAGPKTVWGKKAAGLMGLVKWTGCVHLAFMTQLQEWFTELQGGGGVWEWVQGWTICSVSHVCPSKGIKLGSSQTPVQPHQFPCLHITGHGVGGRHSWPPTLP